MCQQLISMKRNFNWFDHLITGDEKWVMYVYHTRKRQWCAVDQVPTRTNTKAGITLQKSHPFSLVGCSRCDSLGVTSNQ